VTGINIQSPWAYLLVRGIKSVETRTYPLPVKYAGEPLLLIETPGKSRKFKSRIIGEITFSHSFKYKDELDWKMDYNRHRVDSSSPLYSWNDKKPKYGWVVSNIKEYDEPLQINCRKGIIFTTGLQL